MALELGHRLGRYDIRALIGSGGMGEVYLAHDTKLERNVALKLLTLRDSQWRLQDLLGDDSYQWDGNELQGRGLYLDESPWSARVFALTKVQG